jgi:hypothetical protein
MTGCGKTLLQKWSATREGVSGKECALTVAAGATSEKHCRQQQSNTTETLPTRSLKCERWVDLFKNAHNKYFAGGKPPGVCSQPGGKSSVPNAVSCLRLCCTLRRQVQRRYDDNLGFDNTKIILGLTKQKDTQTADQL